MSQRKKHMWLEQRQQKREACYVNVIRHILQRTETGLELQRAVRRDVSLGIFYVETWEKTWESTYTSPWLFPHLHVGFPDLPSLFSLQLLTLPFLVPLECALALFHRVLRHVRRWRAGDRVRVKASAIRGVGTTGGGFRVLLRWLNWLLLNARPASFCWGGRAPRVTLLFFGLVHFRVLFSVQKELLHVCLMRKCTANSGGPMNLIIAE